MIDVTHRNVYGEARACEGCGMEAPFNASDITISFVPERALLDSELMRVFRATLCHGCRAKLRALFTAVIP
jgi:hypothetical protein